MPKKPKNTHPTWLRTTELCDLLGITRPHFRTVFAPLACPLICEKRGTAWFYHVPELLRRWRQDAVASALEMDRRNWAHADGLDLADLPPDLREELIRERIRKLRLENDHRAAALESGATGSSKNQVCKNPHYA